MAPERAEHLGRDSRHVVACLSHRLRHDRTATLTAVPDLALPLPAACPREVVRYALATSLRYLRLDLEVEAGLGAAHLLRSLFKKRIERRLQVRQRLGRALRLAAAQRCHCKVAKSNRTSGRAAT